MRSNVKDHPAYSLTSKLPSCVDTTGLCLFALTLVGDIYTQFRLTVSSSLSLDSSTSSFRTLMSIMQIKVDAIVKTEGKEGRKSVFFPTVCITCVPNACACPVCMSTLRAPKRQT